MPRITPISVLVACAAAMIPLEAAADVEAVRLAYDAPSGCPDVQAFVEAVRARTTRVRIVGPGEGSERSFRAKIRASGSGFVGEVQVVAVAGAVAARSVRGADCDEVARTLAFVTAISIDPRAMSAAAVPTLAEVEPPRVLAPEGPPTPGSAPSRAESETSPVTPAIAPTDSPEQVSPASPERGRAWHLTGGAGAFAPGLAAPGLLAGGEAFVGFTMDTHRILAPEVRVGAARVASGELDASPGSVKLVWTTVRIDACPARWPANGALGLRPCVTGDVGALSASTVGVSNAQSRVRPWGMLGALARLEWIPVEPLMVGADLSLSAPLLREAFFVAPAPPTPIVYRAPALVPAGAIALGVRFP